MDKLVSVIIPAYNSAKYIKEAVDSVLSQTYRRLEIIVIDDGSNDETKEVLKPYIDEKRISYFYKNNGGPASARNLGIKNSQGEYLAFLDADDAWQSDKLEKQLELFSNAKTGLVYSDMSFFGQPTGYRLHSQTTKGYFRGYVIRRLISNNFIPSSSVIIRREIVQEIGDFDEAKALIAIEDYHLWLRIAKKYPVDYVSSPLVKYRVHDKQISNDTAIQKKLIRLYLSLIPQMPLCVFLLIWQMIRHAYIYLKHENTFYS